MSRRERVSGGGIVTRRSPSMTVWHASAYPASRSAPDRRRVDRRRNPPPSSWTEQRPQRPWPPQGWATSIPARRVASTTSDPVGTSTVLPSGSRVTRWEAIRLSPRVRARRQPGGARQTSPPFAPPSPSPPPSSPPGRGGGGGGGGFFH